MIEAQRLVVGGARLATQLHGGLVDSLQDRGVAAAALQDGGGDLDGVRLGVSGGVSGDGDARAGDHLEAGVGEEQLHGVAELVEERLHLRLSAVRRRHVADGDEGLGGAAREGQVRGDDALRVMAATRRHGGVLDTSVGALAAALDGVHGGGAALAGVGEEVQVQVAEVALRSQPRPDATRVPWLTRYLVMRPRELHSSSRAVGASSSVTSNSARSSGSTPPFSAPATVRVFATSYG